MAAKIIYASMWCKSCRKWQQGIYNSTTERFKCAVCKTKTDKSKPEGVDSQTANKKEVQAWLVKL